MSGGIQEKFNADGARTAIRNASAHIQDLIKKFQESRETTLSNLDANATASAAIGGQLGTAAQNAFRAGSEVDFIKLQKNLDIFVNNVEKIVQGDTSMFSEASSIYGTQSN